MPPVTAYIGLGSNLNDPASQIETALSEIDQVPQTHVTRASSFYRSAPVGYRDQPDFVNAVAEVNTELAPRALLDRLLDLDVLLYGDRVIDEPGLSVPHSRLHERAFVVVPLAEIAPEALIPGRGRAHDLLRGVDAASVQRQDSGRR